MAKMYLKCLLKFYFEKFPQFCYLYKKIVYFLFYFMTQETFFVGSPIWKPRDNSGSDNWEGSVSGSEASEPRRPPRGASRDPRPRSPVVQQRSVGFETAQTNGNSNKKETLQSACKRK